MRLEQIKEKYHDELERLNRVCNEFCFGMLNLLREQLTIRPGNLSTSIIQLISLVTDQETQMKILGIQYRFHNVKNKLRQNVFSAILALHKQFNQTRKKKRMLPKKATESLSQWYLSLHVMLLIFFIGFSNISTILILPKRKRIHWQLLQVLPLRKSTIGLETREFDIKENAWKRTARLELEGEDNIKVCRLQIAMQDSILV
jgi:hypothetical protein